MVRSQGQQLLAEEPVATEVQSLFDSHFTLKIVPDDRLLTLSSTTTGQEFVRLELDDSPTSCALSHSDTTLFVGTAMGRLVMLNICYAFRMSKSHELIVTSVARESDAYSVHRKHDAAIDRILVNADGSRLLTGDSTGRVLEWDAYSGSMIKIYAKKGKVTLLQFMKEVVTTIDRNKELYKT